jgi:type 1 glutamine amidotransferase
MRILLSALLLGINLLAGAQSSGTLLIYTHNGKGYVHDNIEASVGAIQRLCRENGITAIHSDDPVVFTSGDLGRFSCIIFSNTNNEAFTEEEQKEAFVRYIRNGGGFVGIHSASGSERQWPWFWAMLGGKFVRHPKYQEFIIKVVDNTHPATAFMDSTWNWEDECYYLDRLNPDIHILLAADLTTVEDDRRNEYPGTVFGDLFPLAWYHEFEGGRQFYTALGHDADHYKNPAFLKHLWGGISWAMRK